MNRAEEPEHREPIDAREARRLLLLIVLLLAGWMLVRALVPILLLFALVLLVAMVLNPIVVWLERRRVPRMLSVALLLLALIALLTLLGAFVVPAATEQVQTVVRQAPQFTRLIRDRVATLAEHYPTLQNALPPADQIAATVGAQAGAVANVLLRSTLSVVSGVFVIVLGILLLVFILSNPRPLVLGYLALVPTRYRLKAHRTLVRLMRQTSAWARGVAINGLIVGTSLGVSMSLIGVQPAFLLGALAFLGEFLPNIGPILVSFPVLFLALSAGVTKFWLAVAALLFIYQVEVNVLVPVILGKEMRMNPVVILFFTVAMAWLFGIAGAILAVPTAALVQIVIDEFYLRPRRLDYAQLDREATLIVRGERSAD
jgi:predicted PurR-regulated permease PerM